MPEFSILDFLDIEAVADTDKEEDDLDEEELENFLNDIEESEASLTRPSSLTPADLNKEASDLRVLAAAATRRVVRAPRLDNLEEVPQHTLVPAQGDPDMCAVRVKPGFESGLVLQIGRRATIGDLSHQPGIASVFARPGIPGYIFLEGLLTDVTTALNGLVAVRTAPPRLVHPDQRVTLLSPRNPLSRRIREGEWVRCLRGLYRGDIGLVCGYDLSSDAEVVVAFIPRIPNNVAAGSAKRKRVVRPDPCKWSVNQVEAMWGKRQVRKLSDGAYEFRHDTYRSGLVLKCLPPASIALASGPADLGPFAEASYIRSLPFYSAMVHRYTQDSITVGQRVRVAAGEQRGFTGFPIDISNGIATVVSQTGDYSHPLQVPLHSLQPVYVPGDHITHRYIDSHGIVASVDEALKTVSFIEQDTHENYTTHMDSIEPYTPPLNFYHFTPGTWVHFCGPMDTDKFKRRGYVRVVEGRHALVVDERSSAEFRIDTRELEISTSQAPSLPANNPAQPLLGKRVVVIDGPRKGYDGYIRAIGNTVTVELSALYTSSVSPLQEFTWHQLRLMSAEEEIARSKAGLRSCTPPPEPECDPPRTLTPEPEGALTPEPEGGDRPLYHSVVPVARLRSRSPTVNRGKVVEGREHPNVSDFLQFTES